MNKTTTINVIIGILNLIAMCFIIFRLGIPFFKETESVFSSTDSMPTFLSALAHQNAVLQTMLAAIGIFIAIAAIWGYTQIKDGAITMALKKINEDVPILVKAAIERLAPDELAKMNVSLNMGSHTQNNVKNALTDGIALLCKDPLESFQQEDQEDA